MRVSLLALAVFLCLPSVGRAAPAVETRFRSDQHVYVLPNTWHPSSMSPAGLAKLADDLGKLPLPSYMVVVRGEGVPAGVSAVRALDDLIDTWLQQGLPDRHAVMMLLWSDDCSVVQRRPEHARCEYAFGVGAAVRALGVTPIGAGAHAIFERAVARRPVDPVYGMQQALRAISDAERETAAGAKLDLARAEADLDSAISLLRHLAEDPTASRDERNMLSSTVEQATAARAAGSTHVMREAQALVESQVRLWVRLQEERGRVRTFRWAATSAVLAILFLLVVAFWYRTRKRLGNLTQAMDPANRDLEHYQKRFGRASTAVRELLQRIDKVRGLLPPSATSAHEQVAGARKQADEADRHVLAASAHLQNCAPLTGRRAKFIALFTGSCPGSDLGRRLRTTYRVDMADSVSSHDAFVFGAATRTRFFRLEDAEGEVSRLYDTANRCVLEIENAVQSVKTRIQTHRSGIDFEALARRAETMHVPAVWLSQHPFLSKGPSFFVEVEHVADRNPVAAMHAILDYERRHGEVAKIVEQVAQAISRVVTVRVADLSLPSDLSVDPADNPRNTLKLAQLAEVEMLRLIEAPGDTSTASPVEAKANETVDLYEKAIAQHGMVLRATRDAQTCYREAEKRLTALLLRLPAPCREGTFRDLPAEEGHLLLVYLRVQVIKRDLADAGIALANNNRVSAMRTLDLVMSEVERAEGLLEEADATHAKEPPMSDAEENVQESADDKKKDDKKDDSKSSGGSVPPPKDSSSSGGSV